MARPTIPRMDARRGKPPSPNRPNHYILTPNQEIQEATASEPLSIEEEYAMQRSWRQDADKLTFIACRPIATDSSANLSPESDSASNMIGDINLFLRVDDGDDGDASPEIIGEIELMIAEKANQRRGFGKAALLAFMRYITERQGEILGEFVSGLDETIKGKVRAKGELKFECLSVKIGQTNEKSLKLFEGLRFVKVSEEPSYFGEFELRRVDLGVEGVELDLRGAGVEGYREVAYERKE